jgi:hypothetical protein
MRVCRDEVKEVLWDKQEVLLFILKRDGVQV